MNIIVSSEIKNRRLGSYNYVKALSVPDGVSVYISTVPIFDIAKGELLTDSLKIMQNDKFANSQELFLNTVGVSGLKLKLRFSAVDGSGTYFETEEKSSLKLDNPVTFIPSNSAEVTINAGADKVINTSLLKGIRFYCTDNINVSLNNDTAKYLMLEDLIWLQNINGLKFTNDTASSVTLTYWSM